MYKKETSEAALKEFIKARLKELAPDCWWFMPPANGFGRAGVPDFVGCYKGRFFAIEAKGSKGRISPFQKKEGEAIINSGGKFIVSFTKETIEAFINELKEGK